MTVADGQIIEVQQRTRLLLVSINPSWGAVIIMVSFNEISVTDEVLIFGAKALREKLGFGVMQSLEAKGLASEEARVNGALLQLRAIFEKVEYGGCSSLRRMGVS